jgi:hypothetical protein
MKTVSYVALQFLGRKVAPLRCKKSALGETQQLTPLATVISITMMLAFAGLLANNASPRKLPALLESEVILL